METAVIGLNHHTASTEIRERAAFTDSRKIEAANLLLDKGIEEVIILSTCNRSEIYIAGQEKNIYKNIEEVKKFYKRFFNMEEIGDHLYIKSGDEALYHLYNVASGLDSIVIGEDQILGQVRDAHLFAMELGSCKKILNKLFREAVATAKRIKTNLKISENALSVSYIGVKFIKEKIGSFKGKNALIIGLGKMGQLSLKYMLKEGFENIYMTNRNHQKAVDISSDYLGVKAVEYKNRYDILKEVDVLITATSSPHTVIRAENIEKRSRELYIMDMAIPRDVDVKAGEIEGVHLYNIDDLKAISMSNERKRQELSREAEKIIGEDVKELKLWLASAKADPVIKSLKERCGIIEKDTLEYIFKKVSLDDRDKKIIEKMMGSALKRLIREPILHLKEIEDEGKRESYIKAIADMFDIDVEG